MENNADDKKKNNAAEDQGAEGHGDEKLIKNTHNIARFFTEYTQVAWVCLAVIMVWGVYGLMGMAQRKDPDVPSRTAMVVVPWPGTKPEQLEQLVAKRVEQAIAQNQWATEIKSVARVGILNVQFDLSEKGNYDASKELDDIKIKLDEIRDLPKARPIMYIKDFGDTSALLLTVASPPADPKDVEWRSKNVESRVREARAGIKPGKDPRISFVVAFPSSIDAAEIDRAVALIAGRMVTKGFIQDPRKLSGNNFSGVDFASNLSDADLRANVQKLVEDTLQSDEFHPDAWQPAIIRDPAKTLEALTLVAGDKYTYRDLDDFTEILQRSVKTLPIVSKAERSGVLDETIQLNYSQQRLAQYKLKPSDLSNIISARNLSDSGGTLNTPGRDLNVITSGELKSADDLRQVIVKMSDDGTPVYLRDLIDIHRGYQSPPAFLNHFRRRDNNGNWIRTRAVTLSVQMRKGQQINVFGEQVNANLEAIRKTLPSDLVLAKTSDQPLQVKDSIDLFSNSLIEALVLVVVIAWIGFWSWRTALLMLAAMPITICMTFGIIASLNIDLQQVSIASLIIALGLLVDVPVVSGDAIERELSAGKPRQIAAWLGPTKLFKTMAYATLTNVVSYLPFLLLQGDTGKFLYSLPIVISVSLISALAVSMTFVPLISAFLLRSKKEVPIEERRTKGFTGWYFRTAKKGIEHRKVCFAFSLLLLVGGGICFTTLNSQFFPKDLQYFSYLDVWLPEDSPLSATRKTSEQVEEIVERVAAQYGKDHSEKGKPKEVLQSMTAFIGGGGPRFWTSATPEDKQTNYAQIILRTEDKHDTTHLLDLLQPELDRSVPGAIIDTRTLETGKPIGISLQVRVSGEDLPKLKAEAEKLKKIFRDIPMAARVRDDWGESGLKSSVTVNADRANLAKVTNADVSEAISGALMGVQAGTLREGDKQIPILARLRMDERAQLSDLRNLYIFSRMDTSNVPLQQIADISLRSEIPKFRRFDQYRTVTVQCWPRGEHLPSEVLAIAMPQLDKFKEQLPNGFIFRFAGERKEQVSGFSDLVTVLVICVLGIYLALLAQFKHAVKPLVVFAAIPYGVVGAAVALAVMRQPFGFMAFLGVISLIGVIVSHIIVLFEFIEERREEGEELELALIDAGILRLRPVVITVAATVTALFPLAAHGGPLWESLCYAQIGGLTIATFVTLGLVPILYSIVVLDLKWIKWESGKKEDNEQTEQHQQPQAAPKLATN